MQIRCDRTAAVPRLVRAGTDSPADLCQQLTAPDPDLTTTRTAEVAR